MGAKENGVWNNTKLRLSRIPGLRIFRNSVGMAWAGKGITLKPGQLYRAQGGERVIMQPRPVAFGLFNGSGDGIGWVSRLITADMVGSRIAQFLSVETKAGEGTAAEDQKTWDANVKRAGGISVITKDPEQAAEVIQGQIEGKSK